MKTKLFAMLALALALLLTGCPPGVDPNALQGLGDLSVRSDNPGELIYSFSETVPSADSYTLYHIQCAEANVTGIIAEGNGSPVFAGSNVLAGFVFGEYYSVVVVARRTGFADVVSAVKRVEISRPESLADLEIRPGSGPGELIFSFTPTIPPATYVMHYVQGSVEDADEIMNIGTGRPLSIGLGVAVDDSFTPGENYSIVVVAQSDGGYVVSNVVQVRASAALVFGVGGFEVERGGYNRYNADRIKPVGRNHIELAYSFGAPVPAAEYYSLYFLQGAETDPANIITHGNGRRLDMESGELSGFTTDIRLSVDHEYSVVVVARGAVGGDLYSAVLSVPRVPNNILIVHGIPEHSEVMVSAILSGYTATDLMFDRFDVVAVGYRIPGTGMFVFYELDEYDEYDPNTPWVATETRFVTLSDSEEDGVGNQFIVHGGLAVRLPARIEVTNRLELTWTQFMRDFR